MPNKYVQQVSPVLRNKSDLSFNTSGVNDLIMANGIYDRYDMEWYRKFTRFGIIDPHNSVKTTREYVFITKPDLCLIKKNSTVVHPLLENYPFFNDAVNRYFQVCRQLQSSESSSDGPFMTMLSNSLSSTLDLPGISADMVETGANIMGTKIGYRSTSMQSDENFDFSLEFEDTRHLDIYMLFKIWDEYEKMKWNGILEFNQSDSLNWYNYTINHVLHDQVSVYKIVVDEDGSRILYWARITGCVPTSVPREAFSDMNNSNEQKITVGWRGHFVRDMDPIILAHFNSIVSNRVIGRTDLPLYNQEGHHIDGRWSSCPYIECRTVNNTHQTKYEYFLKWKV